MQDLPVRMIYSSERSALAVRRMWKDGASIEWVGKAKTKDEEGRLVRSTTRRVDGRAGWAYVVFVFFT